MFPQPCTLALLLPYFPFSCEQNGYYDDLLTRRADKVSEMLQAFRSFIGENQMTAYFVMMARGA